MPVTYHIDKINKIVFVNATGEFAAEDFRIHRRGLADDPDFDPHYGVLFDLRSITEFRLSSAEIREFALSNIFHKRARRAYLAPTKAVYGMIRMFSLRSDFDSDVIQIFRDMAEARRWLALD
jgi:hypothetical protein